MENNSKTFTACHDGMIRNAIVRALTKKIFKYYKIYNKNFWSFLNKKN